MSESPYIPLMITCTPITPIISDSYLPLDGVLLWAAMHIKRGWQVATMPGQTTREPCKLPLRKRRGNGFWYYHCSFAIWSHPVAVGVSHWSKRFDHAEVSLLDHSRGSVEMAKGRYRPMRIPVQYRHCLRLTWYACGVPDQVRELLRHIHYLGKKSSQGYGFVRDWHVEQIDHDISIRNHHGQLMRSVHPSDAKPGDLMGHYGLHPPYWRPDHQQVVALPDT